jgi:hypothetical protein
MYLNATENTNQSGLLHSLGDAINMYNVDCDTCNATINSHYYCFLFWTIRWKTHCCAPMATHSIFILTKISISTKHKTIKITVVAFYNCCSLYCWNQKRLTVYIKEALTLMATLTTFPRQQWLRERDTICTLPILLAYSWRCFNFTGYSVSNEVNNLIGNMEMCGN